MTRQVEARPERWPLRDTFTIARGSKNEAQVVVVTITANGLAGRGECVPYARYGETVAGVLAQIHDLHDPLADGLTRAELMHALAPGAARNAIDCALWDLEAKQSGRPVWRLAGLTPPQPLMTAYTLSIASPAAMADAARANAQRPLLKVKLGSEQVLESIRAVRLGAPAAELIIDANEAWTAEQLEQRLPALKELGVALIEQPLPAGQDQALAQITRLVPVAADESFHGADDVANLQGRYDVVNLKLDKTGGLTAALECEAVARAAGLELMIGCMVSTSLAVAPATLLGARARFIDLDGPLLLSRDRDAGLVLKGDLLQPPQPSLWG
jgi:L-alanine-DL-glutamate epimerase-like enolase superfamily enzyme